MCRVACGQKQPLHIIKSPDVEYIYSEDYHFRTLVEAGIQFKALYNKTRIQPLRSRRTVLPVTLFNRMKHKNILNKHWTLL